MKSPDDIVDRLAKQWHYSSLRVERLLSVDAWPLELNIGKPTSALFLKEISRVQDHVQQWKNVDVGEVVWEQVKYRTVADVIKIPVRWRIRSPSEWSKACSNKSIENEFKSLEFIVSNVHEIYRELLVRDRNLWRHKDLNEVVSTAALADSLLPGAASGRPLRLMAGHGVDTKFMERNSVLLTRLLDERFEGEASEQGLHSFLDAYEENDHWVLVVPLDKKALPFRRQRVATKELSEVTLPAKNILVVENDHCIHQLPELTDTIAVLGAGLDLLWLKSTVFKNKTIAYWGDMDSWGLLMLARARKYFPALTPLLMNKATYETYCHDCAVPEPISAGQEPPVDLTEDESCFYLYLLDQECGRLEQEYLPPHIVKKTICKWHSATL